MNLGPEYFFWSAPDGNVHWVIYNPISALPKRIIEDGGYYQKNIADKCASFVAGTDKDILDIGANMGSFCVPTAKQISGTVYAFECQSTMFKLMCTNAVINRCANIKPVHAAVVDKVDGDPFMEIPVPDYSQSWDPGAYSLTPDEVPYFHGNIKLSGKTEKVRKVTIDDFNFTNVGAIKIDVEGLEESVIRGMTKTLEVNNYPPILFESWETESYTPQREQLMQYVQSLGYKIEKVENDNFLALKE